LRLNGKNKFLEEASMQKKIMVIAGILAIAFLLIIGCEGERGVQGDPGTATCFGCHSDDNLEMVAIERQWQNSNHGIGETVFESGRSCSRCHTGQGFISVHSGDMDTIEVTENPSVIHCFVCHAPHTEGDFNVRVTGAVAMPMGGTFDGYGNASLCASCHQARSPNPPFSSADSIAIGSSRWGPHHSGQGDVFSGQHAYVFPGEDYDTTSPHNNASDGCLACHMAGPVGDIGGGHTFNVVFEEEGEETELTEGCNVDACHGGDLDDFSYEGLQDTVAARLERLRLLLVGADFIDPTTNLVNASRDDSLRVSMDEAGAIFNFLFIEDDRSHGVHNPDYALDVLDASIAFMGGRLLAER
jgi:hypothetical protein